MEILVGDSKDKEININIKIRVIVLVPTQNSERVSLSEREHVTCAGEK